MNSSKIHQKESTMFNEQQKQTKERLQVKLSQFLSKFRPQMTLPEYNFLLDACLGIIKSRSVICLQMARSLNEQVTVKKICERFTRHLNKQELGAKLRSTIISKQCRGFDSDTAIIVDDSDIVKPKAKCMEGLKLVRDGSTGAYDKLGYDLLNIIACQDSGEGYEIKPLGSELISRDLEEDSLSQITEDRLVEINLASKNRGVYIFDRGYDSRYLFSFLKTTGMNYIVRSTGERSLIIGDRERGFLEVARSVKLNQHYRDPNTNKILKCGIKRVSIRLHPHPVKHPEVIDTWLVVARHTDGPDGKSGFFYFFCDFPGQPDLNLSQIGAKVLRMYRMRWKIEEMHKHVKQAYQWEMIQLSSYTRLQNMNQLLLLTMCFLYSLKSFAASFLQAFPNIMAYTNQDWKKIFGFIYYKLTMLLNECFSLVTRRKINPYKGVWAEKNQLIIPCLKKGGM